MILFTARTKRSMGSLLLGLTTSISFLLGFPNDSPAQTFEPYGEIGVLIVKVDLPQQLELTPTHPADVDESRPPRSQETPLGIDNMLALGLGFNIMPLKLKYLKIGYRVTFLLVSNDFRTGSFSVHKPYKFFIGSEEAYTYTRIDGLGPISEFRATYTIVVVRPKLELDLGAKYSFYNLTVKQGWDRFDRDEVFQISDGRVRSLLPIIRASLEGDNGFRFGLEFEGGRIKFSNISKSGTMYGGSFYLKIATQF